MDTFLNFLDSIKREKSLINIFKMAYLECVYEKKPTNFGAGILFVCPKTKRLLLVLRTPDEEDPGVWCTFGGKGELGESPIETAIRETFEEGKIRFDSYKLVKTPLRINRNSPNFMFVTYLGITDEEFSPQLNHEHSNFCWVDMKNINSLQLHFGIRNIVNNDKDVEIINTCMGI